MIDLETLKNLRELGGEDDPEFIKSYYTAFMEPLAGHLANIQKAIQTQDGSLLERSAHALKSSCGNAGAFEIQKLCATLEDMGSDKQFAGAAELGQKVAQLYPQLIKEIQSLPEFTKPVPGNH